MKVAKKKVEELQNSNELVSSGGRHIEISAVIVPQTIFYTCQIMTVFFRNLAAYFIS